MSLTRTTIAGNKDHVVDTTVESWWKVGGQNRGKFGKRSTDYYKNVIKWTEPWKVGEKVDRTVESWWKSGQNRGKFAKMIKRWKSSDVSSRRAKWEGNLSQIRQEPF